MLTAAFGIVLSVMLMSAAQAQTVRQRLQAIFAMSAEEMAATSAFTRRAYEAQIAQIYRIQNKQIRDVVLELVRNPAATAFGQKSSQSWLASPGSGWKSHHAYPGGLVVHTMEWVEVANGWVDVYDRVYGVKLDRDLVIAGLILHDWGKVWFLFDDATGTVKEPDWYPKAWGTKANWKWMCGHGAVLYRPRGARSRNVVNASTSPGGACRRPGFGFSDPEQGLSLPIKGDLQFGDISTRWACEPRGHRSKQ